MTLYHSKDKLVADVFPVGMQNSELVLQDDEKNSVVTELDELSSVSEQNVVPSSINIENSKDVIIGPVTQFHGPVTIYQSVNGHSAIENASKTETNETYQNGKLVKSESLSSDTSHPQEKPNKTFLPQSRHLRYIAITLLIVIIISIIASCSIILSNKSTSTRTSSESTTSTEYNTDSNTSEDGETSEPLRPDSRINRNGWHGHKPLNTTKPLHHPVPLVIISHTVTPFCDTFDKCSKRVLNIQEYHMNRGSPDIGYNFLVGGDGRVYVGRGWDIRNFHADNSIGISFIGNYITDNLTEKMINATKELLREGVETGKLAKNYKLVAHSQTFATESPGRNVINEIKTWSNFDPNYRIIET